MAYTPPAGDAIAFVFSTPYTPPAGDNLNFVFGDAVVAYNETVAETLAALDAAGLFGELIETLMSSIGLVDAAIGGLELYNTLAESVVFQDIIVGVATLRLLDALQCGDANSSLLNALNTIHDTLSGTDTSSNKAAVGSSASDSLSADDAVVSRMVTAILAAADTLGITDADITTRTALAHVVDAILVSAIMNTAGPSDVSVTELLSTTDGYATRMIGANTAGDGLYGEDAVASGAIVGNSLVILLQMAAIATARASLTAAVGDSVTPTDATTSKATVRNAVAISAALSDASAIYGVGTNSLLSDVMVAVEAARSGIVGRNSIVDVVAMLDAVELLFGLSPYDIINLVLSLARSESIDSKIVREVQLGNITVGGPTIT